MSLALLHSPAQVLARAIVQLGGATLATNNPLQAWPVSVDDEPNEPGSCLTVYNTTARGEGRTSGDGEVQQHYGVQIRVRADLPTTSAAKAYSLLNLLSEGFLNVRVTVDSATYLIFNLAGLSVLRLGKDVPNTKRYLNVINATLALTRTQ